MGEQTTDDAIAAWRVTITLIFMLHGTTLSRIVRVINECPRHNGGSGVMTVAVDRRRKCLAVSTAVFDIIERKTMGRIPNMENTRVIRLSVVTDQNPFWHLQEK